MRILFVRNHTARFIDVDRNLLSERFHVTDHLETSRLGVKPGRVLRLVRCHDLVFCWFASWHSFFPVLFAHMLQKPSIVVIGGHDTANLPQIKYGSQRKGLRRLVSRRIINWASALIVNSQSAKAEAIQNAKADPNKVSLIYHGLEPIPMGPLQSRPPLVLTVGFLGKGNLLRKGHLPFVRAAAHFPSVRFIHAGAWERTAFAALRKEAGPNVEFVGFLSDDDLWDIYARASVYVQASAHEAFGLSLAEAMMAGCIPVVTRAGSLPEVMGDTGIYTESTDPPKLATAIRQALQLAEGPSGPLARAAVRARIASRFPMEHRRRQLLDLVEKVSSEGASAGGWDT